MLSRGDSRAIRERGRTTRCARGNCTTSGPPRRELRTGRQPGTLAGSAECAVPLRAKKRTIKFLIKRGEDSSLKQRQLRFHKVSRHSRQRKSRDKTGEKGRGNAKNAAS